MRAGKMAEEYRVGRFPRSPAGQGTLMAAARDGLIIVDEDMNVTRRTVVKRPPLRSLD